MEVGSQSVIQKLLEKNHKHNLSDYQKGQLRHLRNMS